MSPCMRYQETHIGEMIIFVLNHERDNLLNHVGTCRLLMLRHLTDEMRSFDTKDRLAGEITELGKTKEN